MGKGDWFRALQVPVLPVSVGPALVGGILGARLDRPWNLYLELDLLVFVLVILSLVFVQVGANLHKGIVESADLGGGAARPRSPFVFDAGAVRRVGIGDRSLRVLMYSMYGAGAGLGLIVVAITADWRLLVLGGLGAFLAYSYSGPPLKLSYFGIGEVSTFLAFGPVTVLGAALAQDPGLFERSSGMGWGDPASAAALVLWVGAAIGGLTAMISFARYFPSATEDREKGKRTPVVRLGSARASGALLAIALASAVALWVATYLYRPLPVCDLPPALAGVGLSPIAGWVAAAVTAVGVLCALFSRKGGPWGPRAVALVVVLQVAASVLVAFSAVEQPWACG